MKFVLPFPGRGFSSLFRSEDKLRRSCLRLYIVRFQRSLTSFVHFSAQRAVGERANVGEDFFSRFQRQRRSV